ncbi:MAG: arginase family protein [Halobacteriaceae archaeon]
MFPGAGAGRERADYAVVGAPLDVSASFRPGARFGPDRVRALARGFEDYDRRTDARFSALGVHDAGDVRAWPDAAEYLDFLAGELGDFVADGVHPLLLGGEHTVSIAGVRATSPDVVVCLDAHLDLRESYDGEPYSHATVTRHALDVAERVVVVGARAGSQAEWERADQADVTVVPPAAVTDLHGAAPETVLRTLRAGATDGETAAGTCAGGSPDHQSSPGPAIDDPDATVYCSVDVDVADPAYAVGTGTPEPGGLSAATCRALVRAVAPHAAGFDVVEVTDRDDGQAGLLGAKLLRDHVFAHAANAIDGTAGSGR